MLELSDLLEWQDSGLLSCHSVMMRNKKQIKDEQPCEKFIICYLSLIVIFEGKGLSSIFLVGLAWHS